MVAAKRLLKNYAITRSARDNEKTTKFKDAGTVEGFQQFFNNTLLIF